MRHASRPLRLIHLSDTHLFQRPGGKLKGEDVDTNLRLVMDAAGDGPPPDLIVHTGDLAHEPDEPRPEAGLDAYLRLDELLSPLDRPVYVAPGNHDRPALVRESCERARHLHSRRHLILGDWQFIFLDSTLPGSPAGHLGEEELRCLAELLEVHKQYAVVCLHHQPVPIGSRWLDTMVADDGPKLMRVLEIYPQVRAVLFGHGHQEFERTRGHVRLLSAPSTAAQFEPGEPEPVVDPIGPGFRWVELHGDGAIETGVVRLEDARRRRGISAEG